MIDVRCLSLQVGDFRLQDINLTIDDAAFGVILGPSGSGKTMLLETIAGLRRPLGGDITICGKNVTAIAPEKRNIAYVPQDMTLFPHLSVRNNICFGARAHRMSESEISRRFDKLVHLLDIGHLLDRLDPLTLSHGEQQRVAIARALMINPRTILLDEPFSALDEHLRRQLQLQLMRINSELKLTILHVTHDREEALMLGDRIGVMIGGRLHQVGDRDDIYYRPATVEVARFLLNQNIFSGLVTDRNETDQTLTLQSSGLDIKAVAYNGLQPGDPVSFGIRPEEIMIIRPGKILQNPVQANLVNGTVKTIMKKGGSHIVLIKIDQIDQPIEIDLPNNVFRDLDLTEGKTVRVSLKMKSIWTIPEKTAHS